MLHLHIFTVIASCRPIYRSHYYGATLLALSTFACSDNFWDIRHSTLTGLGDKQVRAENEALAVGQRDMKTNPNGTRAPNANGQDVLMLLPIPEVDLSPKIDMPAHQIERIQRLIRELSHVDSPDYGYSATISGRAFSPAHEPGQSDAGLLTDHKTRRSENISQLVAFGADALPFLLMALNDGTHTNLTLSHEAVTWVQAKREIPSNPLNTRETGALIAQVGAGDVAEWRHLDEREIVVTIADLCFVAIGQIVNRPYSAIRYQPSGGMIVNSPIRDTTLSHAIRNIWGGSDLHRKLLDSLLVDFYSRGPGTENFQIGAAVRLLYYYPEEASPIVVSRLRGLDVRNEDLFARFAKNGVRAPDLINAVSAVANESVREALLEIAKNTTQWDIFLATLPALGDDCNDLIFAKIQNYIEHLPLAEEGPFGAGYALLVAFGQRFPKRARDGFARYAAVGSLQRRRTMCHVLREVRGELAAELLGPLLTDETDTGWTYAIEPGKNEPRLSIRVCDESAITISAAREDLEFVLQGDHGKLDQQIQAMREKMARSHR